MQGIYLRISVFWQTHASYLIYSRRKILDFLITSGGKSFQVGLKRIIFLRLLSFWVQNKFDTTWTVTIVHILYVSNLVMLHVLPLTSRYVLIFNNSCFRIMGRMSLYCNVLTTGNFQVVYAGIKVCHAFG